MPLGIDDLLFLLASTSALLWAKRSDLVELGVHKAVALVTSDEEQAARRAEVAASKYRKPKLPLLKGFDLLEDDGRRNSARGSGSPGPTVHDGDDPNRVSYAGLVSRSIATPKEMPEYPQVPHRRFRPKKKRIALSEIDPVGSLLEDQEDPMALTDLVRKTSIVDLAHAFERAEREGQWESALRLSDAALRTGNPTCLHQTNVEATLRMLLVASKADEAVAFYLNFAQDMLVADEILVALFDICRYRPGELRALQQSLLPHKAVWSTHAFACALTASAVLDWEEALQLYAEFKRDALSDAADREVRRGWSSRRMLHSTAFKKSLVSAAEVDARAPPKLRYVYHIIIPLVAQHKPDHVNLLYQDMMARDPDAAADVLLRCLQFRDGGRLAANHLAARAENTAETVAQGPGSMARWELGLALLTFKKTPMNVNTLLRLFFRPTDTRSRTRDELRDGGDDGGTESVTSEAAHKGGYARTAADEPPLLYPSEEACSAAVPETMAAAVLQQLLQSVSITPEDATIFTRTLIEPQFGTPSVARDRRWNASCNATDNASVDSRSATSTSLALRGESALGTRWHIAAAFAASMATRKHFHVLSPLASYLARQGQWGAAARAMTLSLAGRMSPASVPELCLSIEACARSGRWDSALFWLERAHTAQHQLPAFTYDVAFAASRYCRWQAGLRALSSMRQQGGNFTEVGLMDLLDMSARQRQMETALKVMSQTRAVEWMP